MKKIILLFSVILSLSISAQTESRPNKTASKGGGGGAVHGFSKNDSLMCAKTWKVISVEEWSVVTKPPGDKNKDDMLHMTLDGKYDLVMFGVKKSGTWIRSGINIYFTDDATKTKFNYKVVGVDTKTLKVDYYSDENGHSIFEYE